MQENEFRMEVPGQRLRIARRRRRAFREIHRQQDLGERSHGRLLCRTAG